jgi:hypothetical protein
MWVLLIFMYTATGDFVSKIPVVQTNQAECQIAAESLPKILEGTATVVEGLCVTVEHWTGEKYMPGVELDHKR